VWRSCTGTFNVLWWRLNRSRRCTVPLVRVDKISSAPIPRLGSHQSISAQSFRRCGCYSSCHGVLLPVPLRLEVETRMASTVQKNIHGTRKFAAAGACATSEFRIPSSQQAVRDTMTDGLLRNDGSSVPTVGQGSVPLSLPRWPRLVSAGLVLLAVLAVLGRTARDRERSSSTGATNTGMQNNKCSSTTPHGNAISSGFVRIAGTISAFYGLMTCTSRVELFPLDNPCFLDNLF
jgi:hypothetical protein